MSNDPICNERGIPQSECPPFCPHDFGPVGPDGFTRLAGYVAEYVNDSSAALRVRVTEAQWNALEMARKADAAERRAEEAEYHVEQLRDARDRAERRNERAEALIDSWEHDAPGHSNPIFIGRLREVLRRDPAPVRLRDECAHEWLDRPESDTRECLICGTEVAG